MRDRLITCGFVRARRQVDLDRWHAGIVCALRGSCTVAPDDTTFELSDAAGALAVANAGSSLALAPAGGSLVALCQLDVRALRRMLNDQALAFSCDPTMRHQASYVELGRCLQELLRTESETGDFADFHRSVAELALVRCLLDGFSGTPATPATRAQAFCDYLDAHYDEALSLSGVARRFGLSTEHFAKVFKAEVGETFLSYLTSVRADVARELLVSSDATVTRVAYAAGFPNTASLNRAFRSQFGQTPAAYRTAHAVREAEGPAMLHDELGGPADQDQAPAPAAAGLIEIDARQRLDSLRRSWRDNIGLGSVASLADARVREQVRQLQRHLQFQHARVACDVGRYGTPEHFDELEECFDYLIDHEFVPHVLLERREDTDPRSYADAFAGIMRRFANRYSIARVRGWRFELYLHSREAEGPYAPYLELFGLIAQELADLGVTVPLMGPGMLPDQGARNLGRFLDEARARGISFGGITIACRPGTPVTGERSGAFVRTADRHYLRSQVMLAREAVARAGYDPQLLMVGSWKDSLETSNIMNDSCYEGANVMQTVLSCWDQVGSLCYDHASDLRVGDAPSTRYLSGKPGLLSRDGIPKPSFHAFDFLGRVGRQLVYADERCLASTNEMDNFQIVCHNCERLNAKYLTTPEQALVDEEMTSYFEEPGERGIRVRITGARPGTYLIKKRFVNAHGGSMRDEALRMRLWCMDDPSRGEIEKLRAASQPQLELERVLATDGVIEFERTMASNEIAYFHVIYEY